MRPSIEGQRTPEDSMGLDWRQSSSVPVLRRLSIDGPRLEIESSVRAATALR